MGRRRSGERQDWPAGLYETRPGYFVFRDAKTRVAQAIGQVPLDEAIAWMSEHATVNALQRSRRSRVTCSPAWRRMKALTYQRAKSRARLFSREIMTPEEFEALWKKAGGYCQITGLPLEPRPEGCTDRIWPWAASLDRIDNAGGYTASNSRIVCAAVNIALNEFGEAVLRKLAHAMHSSYSNEHEVIAKSTH